MKRLPEILIAASVGALLMALVSGGCATAPEGSMEWDPGTATLHLSRDTQVCAEPGAQCMSVFDAHFCEPAGEGLEGTFDCLQFTEEDFE